MLNDFKFLNFENSKNATVVYLHSDAENRLTVPVMDELVRAHSELDKDNRVRAVILTSSVKGFFCNGISIDALLNTDAAGKLSIFKKLYEMSASLFAFSKPHVSLIGGHAMAGGAVLAALSDFRFLLSGPYRIAFNEIRLGLTIPLAFLGILRSLFNPAALSTAILQGKAFKGPEAKEIGFINDIFSPEEGMKKTERFIASLLQSPLDSYRSVKRNMRKEIISQFQENRQATLDELAIFFNDNFTEGLLAAKEGRRPVFHQ